MTTLTKQRLTVRSKDKSEGSQNGENIPLVHKKRKLTSSKCGGQRKAMA